MPGPKESNVNNFNTKSYEIIVQWGCVFSTKPGCNVLSDCQKVDENKSIFKDLQGIYFHYTWLYLHLKLPCYLPSGLAEEVDLHWLEAPRSLATPEVTMVLPGDVNRPVKASNNAISYADMLYYVDVCFFKKYDICCVIPKYCNSQ